MLSCFELVSDLKVNFLKSRIGGVGVKQTKIMSFTSVLNCEIMRTPFKYLGLPIGDAIRGVIFGMRWSIKLKAE